MKIFANVMKILAALAAVAGAVYVVATYGDKIVAWAKKLLNCTKPCECEEVCECTCEAEDCCCEEECACEEACACEAEAEAEAPAAEEAPSEAEEVVAEEADFEG